MLLTKALAPVFCVVLSILHFAAAQEVSSHTSNTSTSITSTESSQISSSESTQTSTSTTSVASTTSASATPTPTPTIPPLIVPDTSGAPFMQKSNLPEGFVFICVGLILGALGLAVLLWRAVASWALNRSVKRIASDRYMSEKLVAPSKSSYSGYHSSNASEDLSTTDIAYKHSRPSKDPSKGAQRRTSNTTPSGSLFFSPTAGAVPAANRLSTLLPAGYYASGASSLVGYSASGYQSGDESPPHTPARPERTRLSPVRNLGREGRGPAYDTPGQEKRRAGNVRQGHRASSSGFDDAYQHGTSMRH